MDAKAEVPPRGFRRTPLFRLTVEAWRRHFRRFLLAAFLMGVVAACTAALAYLLQPAIDDIFVKKDPRALWLVPLTVAAVSIVKAAADYVQGIEIVRIGQRIVADLQVRLFAKFMDADLAWMNDTHSGRLISAFLYDTTMLREAVSKSVVGFLRDGASLIFLVGVMYYQNWRLALIASLGLPVALVMMRRLGRKTRKMSGKVQSETGNLTTLLTERFEGARLVKAYGREGDEVALVRRTVERRFDHMMRAVRSRSLTVPVSDAAGAIAIAAVIFYAGHEAQATAMSFGAFTSFLGAVLMAYQPLRSIAALHGTLQEGLAGADRIYALLDREPQVTDAPGAPDLQVARARLSFEAVEFAYGQGAQALRGISFTAAPGTTVAFVGPSGGGKSTLVNLIPRFYDPTGGRILVDGQDIRGVTARSLRAHIAMVAQEATLFDDTVAANIAYGRPGATRGDIEAAARAAAAFDFICLLPQGFDTPVGESGVRLSGGQRQRICIARAFLRDAPFLLLDEATSALDAESERQVQAALKRLMAGRTTVVVAHRLSTVVDADCIHVVEAGRIVESGRHAELIARGGAYARLYAQGSREDAAADAV